MNNITNVVCSDGLKRIRPKFAVVLTWPTLQNAEYEVAMRLALAGNRIDCDVIFVDDSGNLIWSSDGLAYDERKKTIVENCDFAISLHFHSAKLIDTYTYLTLWNPPEFYTAFGYEKSVLNLASYDSFLSCSADKADIMSYNIMNAYGRKQVAPIRQLFHSPAQPYLEPKITSHAKLFYVGINWERISGEQGRHHELLQRLDAAGMIDIYGPEEFHGVKPWEGYEGYRGSLPFDGHSIIDKINQAGVCLAFSSAAHQRSGIMSNRLFEGLAAGAVIIANPHPIIDQFFSDCVYVVDDDKPDSEICQEIIDIMERTRSAPEEARARALIGQQRLFERFSLEGSLECLVRDHKIREAENKGNPVGSITVVIVYHGDLIGDLLSLVNNVNNQRQIEIHIKCICKNELFYDNESEIRATAGNCKSVSFVEGKERNTITPKGKSIKTTKGRIIDALSNLETPFFCFLRADEAWFESHLRDLVRALNNSDGSYFAGSGKIKEDIECGSGKRIRQLESLIATVDFDLLNRVEVEHGGRFVFRRDIIGKLPPYLLEGLDGLELRALTLWALILSQPVQSSCATYIHKRLPEGRQFTPFDELQQIQHIADSLRGSQMWTERRNGPVALPVSPSAPPVQHIKIETCYDVGIGGNGNQFLRNGFYDEEQGFRWIESGYGIIEFKLPSKADKEMLFLMIQASSRNSKDGVVQTCTVTMNGTMCLETSVSEAGDILMVPFSKVADLRSGDVVTVILKLRHAEQVFGQQGLVVDTRRLGMRVHALAVGASAACMRNKVDRSKGRGFNLRRLFRKLKLKS